MPRLSLGLDSKRLEALYEMTICVSCTLLDMGHPLPRLGKAKVMSYEEARAKRAAKEVAKEAKGKGKRGRECKSAMPEANEAEGRRNHRGQVEMVGNARLLCQRQMRQSRREAQWHKIRRANTG